MTTRRIGVMDGRRPDLRDPCRRLGPPCWGMMHSWFCVLGIASSQAQEVAAWRGVAFESPSGGRDGMCANGQGSTQLRHESVWLVSEASCMAACEASTWCLAYEYSDLTSVILPSPFLLLPHALRPCSQPSLSFGRIIAGIRDASYLHSL